MAEIKSYRDLTVWQRAMDMTVGVYSLVKDFPPRESFALSQQLIRASSSVPANIAEGHGRGTRRAYANSLSIARGSLMEAQTFVILAIRVQYISEDRAAPVLDLITQISKMLTVLRARLLAPQVPSRTG